MYEKEPLSQTNEELEEYADKEVIPFEKIKQKLESESDTEIKNDIFQHIIINKFIKGLEKDLENAGFDEDTINDFEAELSSYDEQKIAAALALPYEIRARRLSYFKKKGMQPKDMVEDLMQDAEDGGYVLGYHVSDAKSDPSENPDRPGEKQWNISGTEHDDRDDMKMAYYATDHNNIYTEKPSKYLYLVRGSSAEGSGHKFDESRNWGRAPGLSVIDRFDWGEIQDEVDELFTKTKQEMQEEEAA